VSVGLALALAVFDHSYVAAYDSLTGQVVLAVVAALYALGIMWMRALARFPAPARLLASEAAHAPDEIPEAVTAWRGGAQ